MTTTEDLKGSPRRSFDLIVAYLPITLSILGLILGGARWLWSMEARLAAVEEDVARVQRIPELEKEVLLLQASDQERDRRAETFLERDWKGIQKQLDEQAKQTERLRQEMREDLSRVYRLLKRGGTR